MLNYGADWSILQHIMTNVVMNCHSCGETVRLLPGQKIRRQDSCAHCDEDLHCCRNCRFFDPGKHNQCAETQAEWVSVKDRSNFCDYFEARTSVDLVRRSGAGDGGAQKQFDSLFKK